MHLSFNTSELTQELWQSILSGKSDEVDQTINKMRSSLSELHYELCHIQLTQIISGVLFSYVSTNPSKNADEFHNLMQLAENAIFFDQIIDHIRAVFQSMAQEKEAQSPTNNHLVAHAKTLAAERYTDTGFSIYYAADHFSLSPVYFNRVFKKEAGISYSEYINNLKLEKAAELLRTGFLSVTEVCEQVGVTNTSYFYTLFKKNFKTTPQHYRKSFAVADPTLSDTVASDSVGK